MGEGNDPIGVEVLTEEERGEGVARVELSLGLGPASESIQMGLKAANELLDAGVLVAEEWDEEVARLRAAQGRTLTPASTSAAASDDPNHAAQAQGSSGGVEAPALSAKEEEDPEEASEVAARGLVAGEGLGEMAASASTRKAVSSAEVPSGVVKKEGEGMDGSADGVAASEEAAADASGDAGAPALKVVQVQAEDGVAVSAEGTLGEGGDVVNGADAPLQARRPDAAIDEERVTEGDTGEGGGEQDPSSDPGAVGGGCGVADETVSEALPAGSGGVAVAVSAEGRKSTVDAKGQEPTTNDGQSGAGVASVEEASLNVPGSGEDHGGAGASSGVGDETDAGPAGGRSAEGASASEVVGGLEKEALHAEEAPSEAPNALGGLEAEASDGVEGQGEVGVAETQEGPVPAGGAAGVEIAGDAAGAVCVEGREVIGDAGDGTSAVGQELADSAGQSGLKVGVAEQRGDGLSPAGAGQSGAGSASVAETTVDMPGSGGADGVASTSSGVANETEMNLAGVERTNESTEGMIPSEAAAAEAEEASPEERNASVNGGAAALHNVEEQVELGASVSSAGTEGEGGDVMNDGDASLQAQRSDLGEAGVASDEERKAEGVDEKSGAEQDPSSNPGGLRLGGETDEAVSEGLPPVSGDGVGAASAEGEDSIVDAGGQEPATSAEQSGAGSVRVDESPLNVACTGEDDGGAGASSGVRDEADEGLAGGQSAEDVCEVVGGLENEVSHAEEAPSEAPKVLGKAEAEALDGVEGQGEVGVAKTREGLVPAEGAVDVEVAAVNAWADGGEAVQGHHHAGAGEDGSLSGCAVEMASGEEVGGGREGEAAAGDGQGGEGLIVVAEAALDEAGSGEDDGVTGASIGGGNETEGAVAGVEGTDGSTEGVAASLSAAGAADGVSAAGRDASGDVGAAALDEKEGQAEVVAEEKEGHAQVDAAEEEELAGVGAAVSAEGSVGVGGDVVSDPDAFLQAHRPDATNDKERIADGVDGECGDPSSGTEAVGEGCGVVEALSQGAPPVSGDVVGALSAEGEEIVDAGGQEPATSAGLSGAGSASVEEASVPLHEADAGPAGGRSAKSVSASQVVGELEREASHTEKAPSEAPKALGESEAEVSDSCQGQGEVGVAETQEGPVPAAGAAGLEISGVDAGADGDEAVHEHRQAGEGEEGSSSGRAVQETNGGDVESGRVGEAAAGDVQGGKGLVDVAEAALDVAGSGGDDGVTGASSGGGNETEGAVAGVEGTDGSTEGVAASLSAAGAADGASAEGQDASGDVGASALDEKELQAEPGAVEKEGHAQVAAAQQERLAEVLATEKEGQAELGGALSSEGIVGKGADVVNDGDAPLQAHRPDAAIDEERPAGAGNGERGDEQDPFSGPRAAVGDGEADEAVSEDLPPISGDFVGAASVEGEDSIVDAGGPEPATSAGQSGAGLASVKEASLKEASLDVPLSGGDNGVAGASSGVTDETDAGLAEGQSPEGVCEVVGELEKDALHAEKAPSEAPKALGEAEASDGAEGQGEVGTEETQEGPVRAAGAVGVELAGDDAVADGSGAMHRHAGEGEEGSSSGRAVQEANGGDVGGEREAEAAAGDGQGEKGLIVVAEAALDEAGSGGDDGVTGASSGGGNETEGAVAGVEGTDGSTEGVAASLSAAGAADGASAKRRDASGNVGAAALDEREELAKAGAAVSAEGIVGKEGNVVDDLDALKILLSEEPQLATSLGSGDGSSSKSGPHRLKLPGPAEPSKSAAEEVEGVDAVEGQAEEREGQELAPEPAPNKELLERKSGEAEGENVQPDSSQLRSEAQDVGDGEGTAEKDGIAEPLEKSLQEAMEGEGGTVKEGGEMGPSNSGAKAGELEAGERCTERERDVKLDAAISHVEGDLVGDAREGEGKEQKTETEPSSSQSGAPTAGAGDVDAAKRGDTAAEPSSEVQEVLDDSKEEFLQKASEEEAVAVNAATKAPEANKKRGLFKGGRLRELQVRALAASLECLDVPRKKKSPAPKNIFDKLSAPTLLGRPISPVTARSEQVWDGALSPLRSEQSPSRQRGMSPGSSLRGMSSSGRRNPSISPSMTSPLRSPTRGARRSTRGYNSPSPVELPRPRPKSAADLTQRQPQHASEEAWSAVPSGRLAPVRSPAADLEQRKAVHAAAWPAWPSGRASPLRGLSSGLDRERRVQRAPSVQGPLRSPVAQGMGKRGKSPQGGASAEPRPFWQAKGIDQVLSEFKNLLRSQSGPRRTRGSGY